jgi:hypothetical protein
MPATNKENAISDSIIAMAELAPMLPCACGCGLFLGRRLFINPLFAWLEEFIY